MNKEYEKELSDLRYKMQKAESFAGSLPLFSKEILSRKLSPDDDWIRFSEWYKDLPLQWGVNRGLYESGSLRVVTNYHAKPYKERLFNIYINTISLYDRNEGFGLEDIKNTIPLFFFDRHNNTFYATDDQIEGLLNALALWYESAKSKVGEQNKAEEISQLTEKLEKLKEV